jgi:hypothetical protein
MKPTRWLVLPVLACLALATVPTAEAQGPGKVLAFNRVRFYSAPKHESAMVGGRFAGSNVSASSGFEVLVEIKEVPTPGQWAELSFPNGKPFRWLRYEAPAGSHGNVAEIEFLAGDRKLNGTGFGSIGDRGGHAWRMAIDGKVETWFDSDTPDGAFVGIDLRDQVTAKTPALKPAPGEFDKPQEITISTPTPGASIRYTLDGTNPGLDGGETYTGPIGIHRRATVQAVALKDGLAPSPPVFGTYLVGPPYEPALNTFHIGNSLTNTTARFALYARTAGYDHKYSSFTGPGAWTNKLWNESTTTREDAWKKALAALPRIDHFTLQPRDFNIAEEADHDARFLKVLRAISPDVQPWLYCEWTERQRQRPTDKGTVPTSQMKTTYPALTWEESMAAMLLYVEELQRTLATIDTEGKRPRILPSAIAMGWIKNMIDHGKFPGAQPGSFYQLLYNDGVHPNANGAYLVDLTWFSAFYRESPENRVLPVGTDLTAEQAKVMQRLAWEVVRNYPDCGLYESGTTKVGKPEASFLPRTGEVTPVTLSTDTEGAWFRYTLDGTDPSRASGYLYCGVVSLRPGMTLKAIAFKSGMADSPVVEIPYRRVEGSP